MCDQSCLILNIIKFHDSVLRQSSGEVMSRLHLIFSFYQQGELDMWTS